MKSQDPHADQNPLRGVEPSKGLQRPRGKTDRIERAVRRSLRPSCLYADLRIVRLHGEKAVMIFDRDAVLCRIDWQCNSSEGTLLLSRAITNFSLVPFNTVWQTAVLAFLQRFSASSAYGAAIQGNSLALLRQIRLTRGHGELSALPVLIAALARESDRASALFKTVFQEARNHLLN